MPVFVLVMTIAIYSVVRFRAKPGDMGDGPPIHGNTRLEVIWVTIPFLMVTALAVYGWIVLDDIEAKAQDQMVVHVTGQQFTWTFEYPGERVRSEELVLPVDRPVEFRIRTNDVLHSFWVPEFRLKSDAVPGLTTKIRLTPTEVGGYQVVCAELCGIGHATMRQLVRVRRARRLRRLGWGASAGSRAARRGRRRAVAAARAAAAVAPPCRRRADLHRPGCGGCHTLAAAGASGTVGPDLEQSSNADAAYIKKSIEDPSANVVQGFNDGVMPPDFGDQLSPEEIDALVKYLLEAQQ